TWEVKRMTTKARAKVHVRKGDLVEVRKGADRGKRGKVLQVYPREGRVVVEGVRLIKRHTRPSRTNPQGGVVESPAPIQAANVMLVCPSCNQAVRYGKDRSGVRVVRVCTSCGKAIGWRARAGWCEALSRLRELYQEQVVPAMLERFGCTSVMQVPRLYKVV